MVVLHLGEIPARSKGRHGLGTLSLNVKSTVQLRGKDNMVQAQWTSTTKGGLLIWVEFYLQVRASWALSRARFKVGLGGESTNLKQS